MADLAVKSNSSGSESRSTSRLLRYPLRSSIKSREEKAAQLADTSNSGSASRRDNKIASSVSKSVDVLDLSGKEKSAKPPSRRLSSPMKSLVPKTPTSDARLRSSVSFGKNTTPLSSDFSRSFACRRFDLLLSASYWLSQIKLSESAAKHSISLGFFKLALEAGCEPLQRMSEELKSYYAQRHDDLADLSETVKEVFGIYGLSTENIHPSSSSSSSQISETSSEARAKISKTSSSSSTTTTSTSSHGEKQKKLKSLDMNVRDSGSATTGKPLPVNRKNPQKKAIKDNKVKKTTTSSSEEEEEAAATLDSRPEDDDDDAALENKENMV